MDSEGLQKRTAIRLIIGLGVLAMVVILVLACSRTKAPSAPPATATATPQVAGTPEATLSAEEAAFAQARHSMVETQIRGRDVTDPDVLRVMEKVPRHRFVPVEYLEQAYDDHPLPIGEGQTISQPYIVALMTELLHLKRGEKVLEIGTGSGYQAAILAELTDEVYTVEIIEVLAARATQRLQELGYTNVQVKSGDGYYGWEEHAPYDCIIVTCAPDHVPPLLIAQLKDGGRLVLPVGPPGAYQSLWQIEKHGDKVTSNNITGVIFVPLTGKH
jgi:protein-L-isoaspartate(D-aspartate) O-methyltransferase